MNLSLSVKNFFKCLILIKSFQIFFYMDVASVFPFPYSFPYFFIFIFCWNIIALWCCVGFCCTTSWISNKYTYISSHLSLAPTLPPSHSSRSLQSMGLSSACYTQASHWLSVLHVAVYKCHCYSQFVPPSPSSTVCTSPFSVSASLSLF